MGGGREGGRVERRKGGREEGGGREGEEGGREEGREEGMEEKSREGDGNILPSENPFIIAFTNKSRQRSLTSLPVWGTRQLPSMEGAKFKTILDCDNERDNDRGDCDAVLLGVGNSPLGNDCGDVMLPVLEVLPLSGTSRGVTVVLGGE